MYSGTYYSETHNINKKEKSYMYICICILCGEYIPAICFAVIPTVLRTVPTARKGPVRATGHGLTRNEQCTFTK